MPDPNSPVHKEVFAFSEAHCDWTETEDKTSKTLLGGKGAALVKMAQDGFPVPPGFTLTTNLCHAYQTKKAEGPDALKEWMDDVVEQALQRCLWLESEMGHMPLVSVRSGAPVSMPGMMDTILNVGINFANLEDWIQRIGVRPALDSYRRLIQMMGATAYGIDAAEFEKVLEDSRQAKGVETDAELSDKDMDTVVTQFLGIFQTRVGWYFPEALGDQLRAAIGAVFESWDNDRAKHYRQMNGLDEAMGTAVNIQAMVFGNMGYDSGTGVLFTRNPSTGEDELMGEFLPNAQGEDVVAGIRTPQPISQMSALDHQFFDGNGPWTAIEDQIPGLCEKLEDSYRDMVDIEFTVQQGKLWLLQSRAGKRSAQAAFRIAFDMVTEGLVTEAEALSRLKKSQYKVVKRPAIHPEFDTPPHYTGLPACPGVVSGKPVFTVEDAVNCKEPCILVATETTPDDIAGMAAARGILTRTGGATSHAAVVARSMDKPCVVGCTNLGSKDDLGILKDTDKVVIDGSTGAVWVNVDVPMVDGSHNQEVQWAISRALALASIAPGVPAHDPDISVPQVICCDEWWGHDQALEAILEDLASLSTRQNIALDIRPPFAGQDGSLDLDDAFADRKDPQAFSDQLKDALIQRGNALEGLSVIGGDEVTDMGPYLHLVEPVPCAPIDYIVFNQLQG